MADSVMAMDVRTRREIGLTIKIKLISDIKNINQAERFEFEKLLTTYNDEEA